MRKTENTQNMKNLRK